MPIEDARTKCCHAIPEKVFGSWEPHDPRIRCDGVGPTLKEVEEEDAAYHADRAMDAARDDAAVRAAQKHAYDHPELVDDYSDADPGL